MNEIKIELAWRQFIFRMYNNKVNVEEKDIEFELSKIMKQKSEIEEYRLSEIEVLIEKDKTLENQISFILDQIQKNGFDQTAEKLSISSSSSNQGDLGWINSKSFSKSIFQIVKNMKTGDISEPIKNANSIVFIKLIDKKKLK